MVLVDLCYVFMMTAMLLLDVIDEEKADLIMKNTAIDKSIMKLG